MRGLCEREVCEGCERGVRGVCEGCVRRDNGCEKGV